MVGSIWSRNCPFVTRSPSRTAILVMRPVMSAEMSTFFFGWILPLAVTAATRARRLAFSNRTSAQRPPHRCFERGDRLVIVVDGVHIVALRPQLRHLGVQ